MGAGAGQQCLWVSEHSRHSARCLINVIWRIFAHMFLGTCWDLHSAEKEPELGLGGLCLPLPTVGVNWKDRDLNTGLLVFGFRTTNLPRQETNDSQAITFSPAPIYEQASLILSARVEYEKPPDPCMCVVARSPRAAGSQD